ncbi:hypothetical protein GCM10023405_44380 [Streptomonospora salina]
MSTVAAAAGAGSTTVPALPTTMTITPAMTARRTPRSRTGGAIGNLLNVDMILPLEAWSCTVRLEGADANSRPALGDVSANISPGGLPHSWT